MVEEWFVDSKLDDRPPDIIVCVGPCHFHVHKDVLIKHCDYFKAMFSSHMLENAQNVITIKLIEKYPFEILLQGFYSGHLPLTADNVFQVTLAAHIFQVSASIFKQCCSFMKNIIDSKNCFEILHFSQYHNLQEVYDASRKYCIVCFSTLCKEESFLNLTLDQVVGYLSDEFLIADGECAKILAFIGWCEFNNLADIGTLQEALNAILNCRNGSPQLCHEIAQKIARQEDFDDQFMFRLNTRALNQDLMMFWALLSDSKGEGLVDVVKLSGISDGNKDVNGLKFDAMTDIVEKPGFDLGSAVCGKGQYVYVCGGGPNFGRMDWIRDIWRYSVLEDSHRWKSIGKVPHPLRYHAMIPICTKLYIFGGFGKFRSKNCNLESFDIVTGAWNQHAHVPTWEIRPVATYHHSTIYYICRDWNIYAYNTMSNEWTILEAADPLHGALKDPSQPFYPSGNTQGKPLSCFMWPSEQGSTNVKFVILSQGNRFQTHTFGICANSKTLSCLESVRKHEVPDMKTHSFLSSCVIGNRIVILFKKHGVKEMDGGDMDSDHMDQKESECTPIHAMYFFPESGELREGFQINNLIKTQSLVAVPFVPKTFNISINSCAKADGGGGFGSVSL